VGQRPGAAKKNYIPDEVKFQTKPQIALALVDRALANGICVKAWTFDELYGRDGQFLDGLDARRQAFVGEVPPNFHVWLSQPSVLRRRPKNQGKKGRRAKYPRLARRQASPCEVQNLARYSPDFREQKAQKYRIKDTCHGPEIWEIKWHTCWRKTRQDGRLVSRQGTLIVARHVLTGETKYFFSNRVPGRKGWTLRDLLRVAFGRSQVEACFREVKEELGWDHFECRGWRCIHRHLYVTILSGLFCARVRQQLSPSSLVTSGELLTMEQVRRATDAFLVAINLPPQQRRRSYQAELDRQHYYQRRNATAASSHRKTRLQKLRELGIEPDQIKSVFPKQPPC
jgi:SRSO17 transposase